MFIQSKNRLKRIVVVCVTGMCMAATLARDAAAATALPYMPAAAEQVALSKGFTPVQLVGIKLYPENPLQFEFIINAGDAGDSLDNQEYLKQESQKLVSYFLAALTVPDRELWVNLSPFEKGRVATEALANTELGQDLLGEDYILKQLAASITHPESSLGKKFWDTAYARAAQQYGTTNPPINTFNKIWIVPNKASIYEDQDKAIIGESSLKVMMEEDYFAAQRHNNPVAGVSNPELSGLQKIGAKFAGSTVMRQPNNALTTSVMKEIIVPLVEKDVNTGKNFAQLRQVVSAVILAAWFKRKIKESVESVLSVSQLSQSDKLLRSQPAKPSNWHNYFRLYINTKKTKGIETNDPAIREKIYQQYLEAYKKGVYDLIKKEYEPVSKRHIRRRYFSGGTDLKSFFSGNSPVITTSPIHDFNPAIHPHAKSNFSVTIGLDVVDTKGNTIARGPLSMPTDAKNKEQRIPTSKPIGDDRRVRAESVRTVAEDYSFRAAASPVIKGHDIYANDFKVATLIAPDQKKKVVAGNLLVETNHYSKGKVFDLPVSFQAAMTVLSGAVKITKGGKEIIVRAKDVISVFENTLVNIVEDAQLTIVFARNNPSFPINLFELTPIEQYPEKYQYNRVDMVYRDSNNKLIATVARGNVVYGDHTLAITPLRVPIKVGVKTPSLEEPSHYNEKEGRSKTEIVIPVNGAFTAKVADKSGQDVHAFSVKEKSVLILHPYGAHGFEYDRTSIVYMCENDGTGIDDVVPVAFSTGAGKKSNKKSDAASPMKALVLEDNTTWQEHHKKNLEKMGYEVDVVSTIEEATELVNSEEYSLVISDIGLPDGSGVDFIKDIKCAYPGLKIIANSSYAGNAKTALDSLGVSFFNKSSEYKQLYGLARNYFTDADKVNIIKDTKTKIAVIGATSFLGKNVFSQLQDYFANGNIQGTGLSKASQYGFYNLDVTDEARLKQFMDNFNPDVVIYCAAEANPTAADQDYQKALELNVNPIKAFSRINFRGHFVYLSTDQVFDGVNPPYTVDSLVNPLNNYSRSKVAGENEVKKLPGKWTIIRSNLMYGPNDDMSRPTLIRDAVIKLQSNQTIEADNQRIRHPVSTEDVSQLIIEAIQKNRTGVLHINGEENLTAFDMQTIIAEEWARLSAGNNFTGKIIPKTNTRGTGQRPADSKLVNSFTVTPFRQGVRKVLEQAQKISAGADQAASNTADSPIAIVRALRLSSLKKRLARFEALKTDLERIETEITRARNALLKKDILRITQQIFVLEHYRVFGEIKRTAQIFAKKFYKNKNQQKSLAFEIAQILNNILSAQGIDHTIVTNAITQYENLLAEAVEANPQTVFAAHLLHNGIRVFAEYAGDHTIIDMESAILNLITDIGAKNISDTYDSPQASSSNTARAPIYITAQTARLACASKISEWITDTIVKNSVIAGWENIDFTDPENDLPKAVLAAINTSLTKPQKKFDTAQELLNGWNVYVEQAQNGLDVYTTGNDIEVQFFVPITGARVSGAAQVISLKQAQVIRMGMPLMAEKIAKELSHYERLYEYFISESANGLLVPMGSSISMIEYAYANTLFHVSRLIDESLRGGGQESLLNFNIVIADVWVRLQVTDTGVYVRYAKGKEQTAIFFKRSSVASSPHAEPAVKGGIDISAGALNLNIVNARGMSNSAGPRADIKSGGVRSLSGKSNSAITAAHALTHTYVDFNPAAFGGFKARIIGMRAVADIKTALGVTAVPPHEYTRNPYDTKTVID